MKEEAMMNPLSWCLLMVAISVLTTDCLATTTPQPPANPGTSATCSPRISNSTSQPAADVVFLLDGSGSVAANQFTVMKTFVKNVTRSLIQFNTSFAFVQYSSGSTVHVNFHQFSTVAWESQVDSITQIRGGTSTARAIQTVVNTVFDPSAGARPDAHRILIVITDGQSSDASLYPTVTSLADAKNITRYAIGIGNAFNNPSALNELSAISSSPDSDHVFKVDNFDALDNISSTLEERIMEVQGVVTTDCLTTTPTPPPANPVTAATCSPRILTGLSNSTSQPAADVVFLLDGSGSVAANQFTVMKTFVKNVTRSLIQFNTSFAFVQYSSGTSIHVNFDQFNRTKWESQVDSISKRGGGTSTARAIQTVVNTVFDPSAGARPDAHRILIVITDGQSSDASLYPTATSLADAKNITRYAIGIGNAFNNPSALNELSAISSSPDSDHVFKVDNFDALDNISSTLEERIMEVQGVVTTDCLTTTPTPPPANPVTAATCSPRILTGLSNSTSQPAAEVVFLLDGSGSVAASQFTVMKTFVKNVTRNLIQLNTSFAFVQYSSGTSIHVNFDQFNRTKWESQVDSISKRGGGTSTARAIQTVVNTVFDPSAGARPDAHRILIVITDGQSSDASLYPTVTSLADAKNITRYAIGIGNAFNNPSALNELSAISSSPDSDHVFKVDNFDALDNISSTLEERIMEVQGVVTTDCLTTTPTPPPANPVTAATCSPRILTGLSNSTSQPAADVVFLLDGSGSVAANQFTVMKTFVKNVTRSLIQLNTSFAFVQYSSGTSIHVNFDQFNRTKWESQVDSISKRGGGTSTARAIQTVVNTVFDPSAGARPDAHRILIVITDGQSSDASLYPTVTSLADAKNITRYAIGIGNAFNNPSALNELSAISSSPDSDHVFKVDNFDALDNISSTLEERIMEVQGVVTTDCLTTTPTPPPANPVTAATCSPRILTGLSNSTSQPAADVVFLLDGSGSVAANQFTVMKTFVKNVTRSLIQFNTSFAFVQYSSGTSIHVNFDQFNRTKWESQVDSISKRGGGTSTARAIQTVVNTVFDPSAGARPDAHRILIVITDGRSSDASLYPTVTSLADAKNITRYAIGIGNAFNNPSALNELSAISSSPDSDHVFKVDNFDALDNISSTLEERIMEVQGVVTTDCLTTTPTPPPANPVTAATCSPRILTGLSNSTSQPAAEVVFLLDGSGSVAASQFTVMKTFVKNVTRNLIQLNTSFAFVQYSSGTSIHVNFDQFNRTKWESQVDSISKRGGGTSTARAIQTVVNTVFDPSAGARPDAHRILIVITDGQSSDASLYPTVTSLADAKNITRYAIGIGNAFNNPSALNELSAISSSPDSDHVFKVDNFDALDNISSTLEERIMEVQGVVTTDCLTTTPTPPPANPVTAATCSPRILTGLSNSTSQPAADVVFLLDGSGSVAANQFTVMKTFVKNVTRSLIQFNTSFAFVQYSSGTSIHVNFDQFNRTKWESQVDSISKRGGGTSTARAIQTVVNTVFDPSAGARPDAHRILIVITDGQSSDASLYPTVTSLADAKNITRYAIGIGNAFNNPSALNELSAISSSPDSDHVFKVNNFDALDNISSTLEERIMEVQGVVTTDCLTTTPTPPPANPVTAATCSPRILTGLSNSTSQPAAEVVFLLDGSGSVAASQFTVMKTFVKNVTRNLIQLNTSFAFVQYSSGTSIHVNFDQFNRTKWESQVDSISKRGGGTSTARAIQTVVNTVFDPSAGARPDAHRILIVITDGQSSDASLYPTVTSLADAKNITRYAIGIGNAFNNPSALNELSAISSSPDSDHVFKVDNFDALDNISSTLEERIMEVQGVVTTDCLTTTPTPPPANPVTAATCSPRILTGLSNSTSQPAADVVFLLDGSGSVAANQFTVMKTFVKNVTRSLIQFNTSFAFVQYSSGTSIHVNFDQFNRTKWESQVDSISKRGGGTSTARAIQTVVNTVFDPSAGARPDAHRILIVITDGQSSDASLYPTVTSLADAKNITRYAIGIGNAFNNPSALNELSAISSSPDSDHVFKVDNFDALDNISSTLEERIMEVQGVVTTDCLTTTPTPPPANPVTAATCSPRILTGLSNSTSQPAADVVFLLDGSGSVAASQFTVMKTFVKNVTRNLIQLNTSFAFVQYSSGTSIHVNFDQFNRTKWESQVDSISKRGGGTSTARAIQTVVNTVFDPSAGARPDAHRILIVITDGQSSDASLYPTVTSLADAKNITRYAIGIGNAFNNPSALNELSAISSSPDSDHVFKVDNFDALDNISSTLEERIMEVQGGLSTECLTTTTPQPSANPGTCSSTSEMTTHTSQASADIAFLLDGSGSVAAHQFTVMKAFVKNVTGRLLQHSTSFAFVQYSSGTSIHVTFDQFNRTEWESQVDSIVQIQGGTNTAAGIRTVVNTVFDPSAGARPDAHRILIVITDGQSSDASLYPTVTSLADAKNITRYAIGIGNAFNNPSALNELSGISSSPDSHHVFKVDNFEALDNISSRLEESIIAIEGLNTTTCLPRGIAARVICMEKFMVFALERSSGIGLHEDHLRLNDPNCTLFSNGTHVLANMSLTTCGTMMEDDGDYLIFRNAVVSFDDPSDIITRRHDVEIEFFCKYPKKSQVTVEFDIHRPSLSFAQTGFGTFTYHFEFFQSDQFAQIIDPNTYPLKFNLGDMMYMQIEAICSVPDTELFAESCSAAPSDNPNEPLSYSIIENGCKVDETVHIYSSHQPKVQLGMKAFKFIGLYDQVFITCSVILCKAGESGSRCSQGCTNSSSSGHIISKREAPIQTAKHYISQGPLRLRRGVSNTVAQPTSVNLNFIVVVGGLLAAVAMVCGALIYKSGKSKVKYERVPSDI